MRRKEYNFNPDTLEYEKVRTPFRTRLYYFVRMALIVFIVMCIFSLVYSFFFITPKMRRLVAERERLLESYRVLDRRAGEAVKMVEELRYRDNRVYRTLFGADTLNIKGIDTPYPPERYAYLAGDAYSDVMVKSWRLLDELARLLYRESVSLDEIQELARHKEDLAQHVPAIWPIDKRELRSISAFNPRRFHPIYKVYRPHLGLDLAAQKGIPVYATADGVVKKVERGQARRGYGRSVVVDHGFGYQTRYAHLDSYSVVPGQAVKRGEQIGVLGNTGGSTASHLHYEVIYMGRHVDPMMYFRQDMTEEDFQNVIESVIETPLETGE